MVSCLVLLNCCGYPPHPSSWPLISRWFLLLSERVILSNQAPTHTQPLADKESLSHFSGMLKLRGVVREVQSNGAYFFLNALLFICTHEFSVAALSTGTSETKWAPTLLTLGKLPRSGFSRNPLRTDGILFLLAVFSVMCKWLLLLRLGGWSFC